jgi:hypothetical protein
MKKKLATLIILTVVSLTLMVTPAYAEHKNPQTGLLCNNTYTSYEHNGLYKATDEGSHQLTDSRYCLKTRLTFYHIITCTSCYYVFSNNAAIGCTQMHSLCGTYIVNH